MMMMKRYAAHPNKVELRPSTFQDFQKLVCLKTLKVGLLSYIPRFGYCREGKVMAQMRMAMKMMAKTPMQMVMRKTVTKLY